MVHILSVLSERNDFSSVEDGTASDVTNVVQRPNKSGNIVGCRGSRIWILNTRLVVG